MFQRNTRMENTGIKMVRNETEEEDFGRWRKSGKKQIRIECRPQIISRACENVKSLCKSNSDRLQIENGLIMSHLKRWQIQRKKTSTLYESWQWPLNSLTHSLLSLPVIYIDGVCLCIDRKMIRFFWIASGLKEYWNEARVTLLFIVKFKCIKNINFIALNEERKQKKINNWRITELWNQRSCE